MRKAKLKLAVSTPFSDFIRNATSEEKERVYMEVMRKATERQNQMMEESLRLAKGLGGRGLRRVH